MFKQESISSSLCLPYWGLESTFPRVDLFLNEISRDLIHNNSGIANQRRAMTVDPLRHPSTREAIAIEGSPTNNPIREKVDSRKLRDRGSCLRLPI